MCLHCGSGYYDHYQSTCDWHVHQSITHHYDSYSCCHLYGPDNIRSARCGSAATVDSEGCYEGFSWPHQYAAATTTSILDALRHMATMGPPHLGFSFRVEPPTILMSCWCLLWVLLCMLFSCLFNIRGLNHWGLQHCSPSGFTLGKHISLLVMVCGTCQECIEWLLCPLPWVGGALC